MFTTDRSNSNYGTFTGTRGTTGVNSDASPDFANNNLYFNGTYGQEVNGATCALARMNMFLHAKDAARIEWCDTLNSPALVEGDGPVLFESLAIIEYLDETHPNPPLMPKEPKARARVRGLSQIVACDSHPLIVPRVREYLAAAYKVDEAGVMKWAQHWHRLALSGLEEHLSTEKETGTYCQGEQITVADICLASQVAGAGFFKVDLAPYPTVARIAATCAKNEAFARAHPLKQPGAPAAA